MKYTPIPASEIPREIRFDIPRQNQGQAIEVAYADYPQRRGTEACEGAVYKRVTDRSCELSDPERVTYYRKGA